MLRLELARDSAREEARHLEAKRLSTPSLICGTDGQIDPRRPRPHPRRPCRTCHRAAREFADPRMISRPTPRRGVPQAVHAAAAFAPTPEYARLEQAPVFATQ